MIHILRNSRNASDPFIRAVQVLKQKKTKLVQIFEVSNSFFFNSTTAAAAAVVR